MIVKSPAVHAHEIPFEGREARRRHEQSRVSQSRVSYKFSFDLEAIMNRYRRGAAMIAAGLSLVCASSSRAEPPPPMWVGTFAVPVVACDTEAHAIAIANAGKESGEALLATYRQMSTIVDDKGDPVCANSQIPYLIVNDREDVGMAHAANGDLMHIWIVHGGTSKRDFWFIFAQPDPQTTA